MGAFCLGIWIFVGALEIDFKVALKVALKVSLNINLKGTLKVERWFKGYVAIPFISVGIG